MNTVVCVNMFSKLEGRPSRHSAGLSPVDHHTANLNKSNRAGTGLIERFNEDNLE